MKKTSVGKSDEGLRAEYDLRALKGGVRGKYLLAATAGTNLVLIEPDLAEVFPDGNTVNRALRLLAATAEAATQRDHKPGKSRMTRQKVKHNALTSGRLSLR